MSATSLVNKSQQEGSFSLSENYYSFFGLGKFANSCSLLHETESPVNCETLELDRIETRCHVGMPCIA